MIYGFKQLLYQTMLINIKVTYRTEKDSFLTKKNQTKNWKLSNN